jgi:hypothetical protein
MDLGPPVEMATQEQEEHALAASGSSSGRSGSLTAPSSSTSHTQPLLPATLPHQALAVLDAEDATAALSRGDLGEAAPATAAAAYHDIAARLEHATGLHWPGAAREPSGGPAHDVSTHAVAGSSDATGSSGAWMEQDRPPWAGISGP